MKYTSDEMNDFCDEYNGEEHVFDVVRLEDTGKLIPYIGWFWREVPFDDRESISLGYIPGGFIGFMMNNKWDYEEWTPTREQYDGIIERLEACIDEPSNKTFQNLYDWMQECKPECFLRTLEEYQAEERRLAEEMGDGPPIFFPDASTNANIQTEESCPNCLRKLWTTCTNEIRVCYCGYQKGFEDIEEV